MFYIKNLSINLPKLICNNLNIYLPMHSRLAIIGRNGVGKSSLLKYILQPNLNTVFITDEKEKIIDLATINLNKIPQYLAYASQNPQFYTSINFEQLINFVKYKILSKDIEKYINKFDIPLYELSKLSGGEMQLAHIISTLSQNSRILLLDEPTTYLDWINKQQLLEIFIERSNNYPCILIAVMHDIENLAKYFTHKLYLMGNGKWEFESII